MTRFRLLGPVGADLGDKPLVLGGPKQRALLAMLLLQPGEVVSRDTLIEGLWGERLPGDSEHALDAQVSALRRSLRAVGPDRLIRRAPGYVLLVDPDELDAACFDAALADGGRLLAAGEPKEAAARLREALDLWEGPALADVLDAPFAIGPAAELEERRLQAAEVRAEAELQLGAGPELIDELDRLVQANPLREWLVADLALALYRAGQQARALETLAAARRRLSADLGIEPSARIRELEGRILRQDSGLRPPADPTTVPRANAPPEAFSVAARAAPSESPARTAPHVQSSTPLATPRWLTAAAGLLALVLLASFLAGDTTGRARAAAPATAAIMAIDPSSGEIGETVPLAATQPPSSPPRTGYGRQSRTRTSCSGFRRPGPGVSARMHV